MNRPRLMPVVIVREGDDGSFYIELVRIENGEPRPILIATEIWHRTTADARAAELRGAIADGYHVGHSDGETAR